MRFNLPLNIDDLRLLFREECGYGNPNFELLVHQSPAIAGRIQRYLNGSHF